ncbi:MAG TPA: triple tyrosine motif-containing protein, partial [Rhodothermales bacterium]|nr:triple tyrosine motif-containing protein [Rhodothermales bacterium]
DSRDRFWIKVPAPIVFPSDTSRVLRPAVAPVPTVHWAFFEDTDGTLWTGTGNGYYRLPPGAAVPTHHYLTTSPSDLATAVRTFLRSRDGALLVGTNGWAYRAAPLTPARRAAVVLTRAQVSNRDGTRTLPAFTLPRLRLSHRDNTLTLEFAALDYHTAQALRYRYRLDGFDRNWVDAGTRRFATYTHLPPGRYVFRAEALPGGHATPLAQPVQIVPAFWQTTWFRGLIFLALAGLVAVAYRWRVARLLEVERLRIRIAGDLHDDFSSDLSGIALATELVERRSGLSERDRRQLRDVRLKAFQMIERLRDVVWVVNPEHDHLADLALRMRHTAATLLPETNVTFDLPASHHARTLPMAARRDLYLVYKEALHNVARHAQANNVHVSLAQHGKHLVLEVRDDGRGFAPDLSAPGQGLKNMRTRATQMKAGFALESRPGDGTTVRVTV